ncbi:MAG: glycosyltransferase family A protein [Deltaproteobacteria bacterium]|nr:glycosyltransferase family A protein [Deltaproteobacteria bacterium]
MKILLVHNFYCSTDNGPAIVATCGDPRVRMIRQENIGVSAARNRGIAESRGDLIAFLDADDEWLPEFLETIMRLTAKHPECAVLATNYRCRDVNGAFRQPIYRGMPSGLWEDVLENYFEIASQSDPPLCSSAVAVKKKALIAIGSFPVGVKSGADLLTWARLAVRFHIAYCTKPLATFWLRAADNDRPTRIPDEIDQVGNELKKMAQSLTGEKKAALQHYIGWWHKTQASMFLRLGMKEKGLTEIRQMMRYSRKGPRLLLYLVLVSTPDWLTSWLLQCIHVVRILRTHWRAQKASRR